MGIIDLIKDRVSMVRLLEEYNIYPTRGKNIYKCFVHDDHRPSAGIVKNTDCFHCYSCGFSGDIFNVVQFFENCDLRTTFKIINDKFNLGILGKLSEEQKLQIRIEEEKREKAKKRKESLDSFEKVTTIAIADRLRQWEIILEDCEPKVKEVARDQWQFCDLYFGALKEIERLEYLYDLMCEREPRDCSWIFSYDTSKVRVLRRIYKGDIEI